MRQKILNRAYKRKVKNKIKNMTDMQKLEWLKKAVTHKEVMKLKNYNNEYYLDEIVMVIKSIKDTSVKIGALNIYEKNEENVLLSPYSLAMRNTRGANIREDIINTLTEEEKMKYKDLHSDNKVIRTFENKDPLNKNYDVIKSMDDYNEAYQALNQVIGDKLEQIRTLNKFHVKDGRIEFFLKNKDTGEKEELHGALGDTDWYDQIALLRNKNIKEKHILDILESTNEIAVIEEIAKNKKANKKTLELLLDSVIYSDEEFEEGSIRSFNENKMTNNSSRYQLNEDEIKKARTRIIESIKQNPNMTKDMLDKLENFEREKQEENKEVEQRVKVEDKSNQKKEESKIAYSYNKSNLTSLNDAYLNKIENFEELSEEARVELAKNANISKELIDMLKKDPSSKVRGWLAGNPYVDVNEKLDMIHDKALDVRTLLIIDVEARKSEIDENKLEEVVHYEKNMDLIKTINSFETTKEKIEYINNLDDDKLKVDASKEFENIDDKLKIIASIKDADESYKALASTELGKKVEKARKTNDKEEIQNLIRENKWYLDIQLINNKNIEKSDLWYIEETTDCVEVIEELLKCPNTDEKTIKELFRKVMGGHKYFNSIDHTKDFAFKNFEERDIHYLIAKNPNIPQDILKIYMDFDANILVYQEKLYEHAIGSYVKDYQFDILYSLRNDNELKIALTQNPNITKNMLKKIEKNTKSDAVKIAVELAMQKKDMGIGNYNNGIKSSLPRKNINLNEDIQEVKVENKIDSLVNELIELYKEKMNESNLVFEYSGEEKIINSIEEGKLNKEEIEEIMNGTNSKLKDYVLFFKSNVEKIEDKKIIDEIIKDKNAPFGAIAEAIKKISNIEKIRDVAKYLDENNCINTNIANALIETGDSETISKVLESPLITDAQLENVIENSKDLKMHTLVANHPKASGNTLDKLLEFEIVDLDNLTNLEYEERKEISDGIAEVKKGVAGNKNTSKKTLKDLKEDSNIEVAKIAEENLENRANVFIKLVKKIQKKVQPNKPLELPQSTEKSNSEEFINSENNKREEFLKNLKVENFDKVDNKISEIKDNTKNNDKSR